MNPTTVDRIAEILSTRIVSGELPAGSRLRQEEIAVEFSASHVPVREAFRKLEADGLVVALPRRGVRVAQPDRLQHFETLEMRAVLEGLALFHAVKHYTRQHLGEIVEADTACSQAVTAEGWQEANRRFHSLLIAPCPLPRLLQSLSRLQLTSVLTARAFGGQRKSTFPRMDRDHKAIISALQSSDAESSATLLTRHIRRSHLAFGDSK